MVFKKRIGTFRRRPRARMGLKSRRTFMKKVPMLKALAPKVPRGSFAMFNDPNPFPSTLKCKLVYAGEDVLSTNTGATTCGTDYTWRLNSIRDPYTGASGPYNDGCYNFGKLLSASGPYTRYKVNAVLIDILAYDPAGTSSDSTEVCAMITNPSSSSTISAVAPYDLDKMPMSVVKRVSDSGSQRRRIKQYLPMYQAFGWSKEQFRADKDNTTAAYNSDPGSIPLLHVAVANARAANPATSVMLRVKLTYFCELYGRITDEF